MTPCFLSIHQLHLFIPAGIPWQQRGSTLPKYFAKTRLSAESGGFTLIELMLVVAIIALLAAIALPRFSDLVSKAREGRTKGSLATFRSAIGIYYADTEGVYPQGEDALVPRLLDAIPEILVPAPANHAASAELQNSLDDWAVGRAWFYNTANGNLFINCTHPDTRGNIWSSY